MSVARETPSLEAWVVSTCRGLGVAVQDSRDDFFAAGGTSLTAVKLIARAEQEFGEDALPADDLFEHSSVREIAAIIERSQLGPPAGGRV